jgi:drug/metabolite transporter (DMT)-like permease
MNRVVLALLAGVVLSGLTPLLVRHAAIDPAATAFWRTALMLPLFLLWRVPASESWVAPRDRWLLLLGGAAYGADIAVWFWAIALTSVANAQLLTYSYPLWVALAAALLLGQRLGPRGWTAIGLGLAGSALLIAGRAGGVSLAGGGHYVGELCALSAALFYTVTMLVQGTVRSRVSTRRVVLDTTLAGALVLLPIGLLGKGVFLPPDAGQWGLLAALAIVTFGSQSLVVHALGRLPVSLAAIGGSLSVGVSAGGAWLLLDEPLGALQGLGIAVVLAALLLAERKPSTRRERRVVAACSEGAAA